MTDAVVEAVRLANVKAILAKGWSGRGGGGKSPPAERPVRGWRALPRCAGMELVLSPT